MTAKEARANMQKLSLGFIAQCDSLIAQKSMEGQSSCDFRLDQNVADYHKRNIINYLKDNGFNVSVHDCYDDNYESTGVISLWIRWSD